MKKIKKIIKAIKRISKYCNDQPRCSDCIFYGKDEECMFDNIALNFIHSKVKAKIEEDE